MIVDIISWVLIGIGAFFVLAGGIGMIRMPDVYTRMHPAGVIDTAGAWFLLVGFMFQAGASLVTLKLFLILAFLFFTSPTATHALAHAARLDGVIPWTRKNREQDK